MDALVQLLGANIWTVVLAVVVAVAGSSAAAAAINNVAEGRRAAVGFRREIRDKALVAASDAYFTYVRYGTTETPKDLIVERDVELARATSTVHARVAAVGDEKLYNLVGLFVLTGELFAGGNEDTSVTDLDNRFDGLVRSLNSGIPK
jgi:hypothetical protein